jgi:DNA-binding transcriptional MerR regulator
MRLMTVSEAARELGRSVDWLREAERKGRIPRATRDFNKWRIYSEADLRRLKSILFPVDDEKKER